jgi:membrane protease YdiL (CAAX protease family)
MENKIPIRFFVITFLWSWLFIGIAILISRLNLGDFSLMESGVGIVIIIFGACGPAIGAIISIYTIEGKDSLKIFLKSFLSLKFGWKTWISIFLFFGISSFTAWILPEFFGENRIETYLPSVYIFPIYILMMVFLGGGQEEIGWRGYIMPHLEKKFGLIIGGFVLGIIWAIWHLPLWFVSGSPQIYMNFFGFMLGCIGYSYIFSWIIKKSNNHLLSGLFAHGVANAFAALFPWSPIKEGSNLIRFWMYNIIILTIGIIMVIIGTYKSRKTST